MSGTETGVLTLLGKAVFVAITVVCIVHFATRVRRRDWHVLVPMLVWLVWVLFTFLTGSAVLVLRPLMNLIGYQNLLAHVGRVQPIGIAETGRSGI